MTNRTFKTLLVLCLITLLSFSGLSMTGRAQECDGKDCKKKKEKIELDLEGLEEALEAIPDLGSLDALEAVPDLSGLEEAFEGLPGLGGIADIPMFHDGNLEKLTAEAERLGELFDLDNWKDEVADLIELSRRETRKANRFLERLHDHWCDDGLCINTDEEEDDDWFVDLLHDVGDAFDREKAVPIAKWMKKKKKAVDRCLERIGKFGAEVGKGAGKWAEAYEEDWEAWGEAFGKRMEAWGKRFGKDMEHWGEALGDDMAIWGKDLEKWSLNFGKDWERWGENLAEDIEIQLNNTLNLNLDSLKRLSDLSVIVSEGGEDMEERIRETVESALGDIDWEQFSGDVSILVKDSLDDARAVRLDNKEMLAGIEDIAEEVARAVEQVGKSLDKHEKGWKKKYSSDWKELIEALDEIGIELSGKAENLEDMIIIGNADEKSKLRKALKEKALLKKREAIAEREDELKSLRKEIKRLKREMERMKEEQRRAREIDV